jgi:hypothetical protein
MELIIGIVLIALTVLFFILKSGGGAKAVDNKDKRDKKDIKGGKTNKQPEIKETNKSTSSTPTTSSKHIEPMIFEDNSDKVVNTKDYLLSSFRKDRELKGGNIYENGKFILEFNVRFLNFILG